LDIINSYLMGTAFGLDETNDESGNVLMILIKNTEVFAPSAMGRCVILTGGGKDTGNWKKHSRRHAGGHVSSHAHQPQKPDTDGSGAGSGKAGGSDRRHMLQHPAP
jgi:hypothetical protein